MKKIILLFAIGAFLISAKSEGQHFTASFGIQHTWGVPNSVHHIINDQYYGYNWVHAKRVVRGRGLVFFDILLQRGDVFVEVNVGSHGRVVGRTYFERYPLHNHVCGSYCGYHNDYYRTHRTVCHSHHHHGHNHVVYRPKYTYVKHQSHKKYHSKPHYTNHKTKQYSNTRYDYKNDDRVRRGRYQDNNQARRSSTANRVQKANRNTKENTRSSSNRSQASSGKSRRVDR